MTDKMKNTDKSICETCVKNCKAKGVRYCPAYQDTLDKTLDLFECCPRDEEDDGRGGAE